MPDAAPVATPNPAPPPETASPAAVPNMAAAEPSKPAPRVHHTKHRPKVYTIRRGDTLWAVAERFFGGGWRYVTIYRDNRKTIRNPHRIYPKQKVDLPKN